MSKEAFMQVKVKSAQKWKDYDKCHLGISLHNPNLTGDALYGIVDWLNRQSFKECFIDLSDTLHRHNYMNAYGLSEKEATKKAYEEGNRWLDQNLKTIETINIPWKLYRWDHWLQYDKAHNYIKKLEKAFQHEPVFRQAILNDVKKFASRNQEEASLGLLQAGSKYLIEEMAVLSYYFETYPCAKIYPGKEQESLKVLRMGQVPGDIPQGMKNAFYTQIWMHHPRKEPNKKAA